MPQDGEEGVAQQGVILSQERAALILAVKPTCQRVVPDQNLAPLHVQS